MRLAFQAAEDLYQHVLPIVARRRVEGAVGNDLIAHLLRAGANGQRLNDHRITNIIRMLLPAAAETTTRSFSNMMVLLLCRPQTLARVAADRRLVTRTVNEALRYEPVSAFLARQAAQDATFHGVIVPKGAALSLATCSASRDESVFEDGDTVNIDRPLKAIASFGMGPHTCLGLMIAKVELESALKAVLDTMPGLRLDPNYPIPIIRGLQWSGIE
jgi:cytochrome P450